MTPKLLLSLVTGLFAAATAGAQNLPAAADSVKTLQTVEVTGRTLKSYKSDYSFFGTKTQAPNIEIPQSISAVTKELIQDRMLYSSKDAATMVAGVTDYSGYDEYTIRGFRAENARDINGLRGYNTTYTSALLVNVERVEVIKGPVATLYGNCDPGGTINLVTKKPLETRQGELSVAGGSWGHFNAQGDITGPLNASKTWLYRLNAGYDQVRSFRDQGFAKSFQVAPSLSFVPNDRLRINLDVSIAHVNTILDRGQPGLRGQEDNLLSTPIRLTASQPGDFLHETDFASTLSLSYKISRRLTFTAGYLHYNTWQNVANHGLNDYITDDSAYLYFTKWNYRTVTNTLSAYFGYEAKTGEVSHHLTAGYDFVKSHVTLGQTYYENPGQFGDGSGIVGTFSLSHPNYFRRPVGSYQVSDYDNDGSDVNDDVYHTNGLYMQDLMAWKNWRLLASLREEFYKGDEDDSAGDLSEHVFLPRIGLTYMITPHISVYGTYNKGFDPFEASTEAQVFDAPFKPIVSELYEAGAKFNFFHDRLSTTVSLYQLTLRNVAVNANDPQNPNLFIQQGKDRSRGFEFEANGYILPNLSASLNFAHCVAEVLQSKISDQVGTIMENAPKNSSTSWLKYSFARGPLKGLGIAAGHQQASKRTTLDPEVNLPGYAVLNGGLYYTLGRVSLTAVLNNITNKVYWAGAYNNISKWPGRPRNFMVGLNWAL